jgi:sulfur-oxidizing protein SoxY
MGAVPAHGAQLVEASNRSEGGTSGPLEAPPLELRPSIQEWTQGRPILWRGVALDLPELVDNGNDVALRVAVASPMAPHDHVQRLAVWASRNPQPLVLQVQFTPRAPRAEVTTRVRLASSQRVFALAELSDGRILGAQVPVLVALAACIEG